jgi:tetratricopeptide (TPR) repeat protein
MHRLVFAASSILAFAGSSAPDPLAESGFQHFYNLEYDQAIDDFLHRAEAAPTDPSAHNHVAQAVLFQVMFANGALESDMLSASDPFVARPKLPVTDLQRTRFETAINRAIDLSQAKLLSDPRDVKSMYALGVAMGLRANWNYVVHKGWLDPLRDATRARKLHNQATDIDPNFTDARLVQGVHDYLVGSLPMTVKMLGFLAGFHGDREEGMRTLKQVFDRGSVNKVDAAVLLAAILRREKRQSQAAPLLEDVTSRFPRNYLFRYELALLYAEMGDRQKAMRSIDVIEKMRAKVSLPAERLEYMRGSTLLAAHDVDAAIAALDKATTKTDHLDRNSASQAWLRFGQALDLKGRRADAVKAYRKAVDVGPQTASAKEAKDYIGYRYKPKQS